MNLKKYPKTLHLPWSDGATNDDKIAKSIDSLLNVPIVITEKFDGSNTSLERDGCFARTHSGAPTHPSFDGLKALHSTIKYDIPDNIQLFGEWLQVVHSIVYDSLPSYFLLFGVRELGLGPLGEYSKWMSWQDVKFWANSYSLSTVSELWSGTVSSEKELKTIIDSLVYEPSICGTTREGVVIRIAAEFDDMDFSKSVMKWVRKNHVNTNEHWKHKQIIKNNLAKK